MLFGDHGMLLRKAKWLHLAHKGEPGSSRDLPTPLTCLLVSLCR